MIERESKVVRCWAIGKRTFGLGSLLSSTVHDINVLAWGLAGLEELETLLDLLAELGSENVA